MSRKYFWRSRKFFIFWNVTAADFYKMKLGEVFFKAFLKHSKREKTLFFEQKINFSEKSFGPIKNPRPETQGKSGSENKIPLLFWALERYFKKLPKFSKSLENAYQVFQSLQIIRISKVTFTLRTFPDLGFWKGSDTQNHLYYNENLFRSIDMMWVSFNENDFWHI